jgi:Asp-tRNA(Asn)/Glu-tRNA(Gln) amidotransferase A subunit family amidase
MFAIPIRRFKYSSPFVAGVLDGVLVPVKDCVRVRGYVTSGGTTFLNAGKPEVDDAPAIANLRAAGEVYLLLILGDFRQLLRCT